MAHVSVAQIELCGLATDGQEAADTPRLWCASPHSSYVINQADSGSGGARAPSDPATWQARNVQ